MQALPDTPAFQNWMPLKATSFTLLQIKERLREAYKADVDPPLSDAARYMQQNMSLQGYRHLLAVGA